MDKDYQNWRLQIENNIVWLYFDRANNSTNTINAVVLDELETILDKLTQQKGINGLIIASAKSNGFIAGADIKEISQLKSHADALSFIQKGQKVFLQSRRRNTARRGRWL